MYINSETFDDIVEIIKLHTKRGVHDGMLEECASLMLGRLGIERPNVSLLCKVCGVEIPLPDEDYVHSENYYYHISCFQNIEKPEEQPKGKIASNWRVDGSANSCVLATAQEGYYTKIVGDYNGRKTNICLMDNTHSEPFCSDHIKLILAAPELAFFALGYYQDCVEDGNKPIRTSKLKEVLIKAGYIDEG